jgi:Ca2+-binding EF-hand superfamily protein
MSTVNTCRYVTAAEFRKIFDRLGSAPLAPEAVDGMLAFADEEEAGRVYYERFVTRLFQASAAAEKAKADTKALIAKAAKKK